MSIFKAYDIRGIYGQDLTEDIFYKIARTYARFIDARKVVVARDCRKSSDSLFAAFSQGLVDEGVDVIDIGLSEEQAKSRGRGKSDKAEKPMSKKDKEQIREAEKQIAAFQDRFFAV